MRAEGLRGRIPIRKLNNPHADLHLRSYCCCSLTAWQSLILTNNVKFGKGYKASSGTIAQGYFNPSLRSALTRLRVETS